MSTVLLCGVVCACIYNTYRKFVCILILIVFIVHVFACVSVCVCMRMCVCVCVCACVSACACVCVCVCVHACVPLCVCACRLPSWLACASVLLFAQDTPNCDLLIVMGTSLVVYPFASIVDKWVDTGVHQLMCALKFDLWIFLCCQVSNWHCVYTVVPCCPFLHTLPYFAEPHGIQLCISHWKLRIGQMCVPYIHDIAFLCLLTSACERSSLAVLPCRGRLL